MRTILLSVAAVLILVAPIRAQIPPPTDAPRPLPPSQSASAFVLPDGFVMQNVASEPLIASPSGVAWDERGRMFVSELHGYNLEGQLDIEALNRTGKLDTQVRRVQANETFKRAAVAGTFGVVKLLRDSDGDGRMDSADVWASDLPPAYGLVAARGGVIVASAPDIVYMADRDGDGKAEVRERLFTGFRTGALERGINAPQWGVDGWIHFGRGWGGGRISGPRLPTPVVLTDSDFRIRADGTAIEPVTGGTHTFGFAMTETGDRFVVNTTIPGVFVAPLPWRYLMRNPDMATPSLEAATGDRRLYPLAKTHPWRRKRADDPVYFKYYRDRYGAAESEAEGWFTAACGPLVYLDHALPGLHGQYFVTDPAGNLIHRAIIEPDGAALKLRRAPGEERSDFAVSRDPWSHPMSLSHGPDGAIWVVDYYREIIEDYSAIPRHLQQQYGVYAGHDRGRIHRLWHRAAPSAPASDMSALGPADLARELGSPLSWRRLTAQRLLVERSQRSVGPVVRALLAAKDAQPSSLIAGLHTLHGLGLLGPADLRPFVTRSAPAVRIRALALADRWFARPEGRSLVAAAVAATNAEQDPRVLVQMALSLGETRDPRAFAALVRLARDRTDVRWMETAILSSLHGRAGQMLAALLADRGSISPLLAPLARAVGSRGDAAELRGVLQVATTVAPTAQAMLLEALASGRAHATGKPSRDPAVRRFLAGFSVSPAAEVRRAARALEDTFIPRAPAPVAFADAEAAPAMDLSDSSFRTYVAALAGPRDLRRGHEVFQQTCATCHRISDEGHVFGPDLLGELGVAEETLVRHLLLPNERIRPGYETTEVVTKSGAVLVGLLKQDGATSLTLLSPNSVEQVLLRKDVTLVRRSAASLMPSFAETLPPKDIASLLAWLRSNLRPGAAGSAPSGIGK